MIHLYRPFVILLLPLIVHGFAPALPYGNKLQGFESSSRPYLSIIAPPAAGGCHSKLAAATGQIPEKQPILARAYARALSVAFRCGTLFGTIDGLVVSCQASSNRNLILGRIASLNIGFDRLSSPFLKTGDFQFAGKNLELGFKPALLLASPFLFLLWRTKVISLSYLLFVTLAVPRLARTLGAGPKEDEKVSVAGYRLGLSAEDLSAPSSLLRMAVTRAMDHLLRNSVVGMLTESTLAAAKVQATTPTRDLANKTPEEQMLLLTAAVENEASTPSSTELELKKVTIGDNGRLLLDTVAAFPDPSKGDGVMSRLDIVVRLAVGPLDEAVILQAKDLSNAPQQSDSANVVVKPNGCGIMVSNAELKASFNKDTLGVPLTIFGRTIPDIWIPVVSGGLAFPLGSRHRIQSIKSWESQDRMEICGELYFNGDAPIQKKNWPFLGGGNGNRPSLPPPKRPVLPGGK